MTIIEEQLVPLKNKDHKPNYRLSFWLMMGCVVMTTGLWLTSILWLWLGHLTEPRTAHQVTQGKWCLMMLAVGGSFLVATGYHFVNWAFDSPAPVHPVLDRR